MVLQFLHTHKKLATAIFSARQKVIQIGSLRSASSGAGIRIPGVSSRKKELFCLFVASEIANEFKKYHLLLHR